MDIGAMIGDTLSQIGGYKIVITFLFVYIFIYSLLESSGIFKRKIIKEGQITEKPMTFISKSIAILISFIIVVNKEVAVILYGMIQNFIYLLLVAFFGMMIIFAFSKVKLKGAQEERIRDRINRMLLMAKWFGFLFGIYVMIRFYDMYAAPVLGYSFTELLGPYANQLYVLFIGLGVFVFIYYGILGKGKSVGDIIAEKNALEVEKHKKMIADLTKEYIKQGFSREEAAALAAHEVNELKKRGGI